MDRPGSILQQTRIGHFPSGTTSAEDFRAGTMSKPQQFLNVVLRFVRRAQSAT
jgi:hypothetical protein